MRTNLLLTIPALFLLSCAQPATRSSLSSEIDAMLSAYNQPGSPGASLSVIRGGKVLYARGYGLVDLAENVPASTQTNYRLASVTKQFTATAILMLVERHALSLDDRLTDVLPGSPEYMHDISIRHLLTHTSGIVDYEDLIPDSQTVQVFDKDVLRLLSSIDSVYSPPGAQFRYSNSAYALLALLVEAKSGLSFADFLQKNIFTPLGMNHTVAYEKGISEVEHRAFGSSRTADGFEQTDQSVTSAVLGDGGIYSSVDDLFRWDQELYNNTLLSHSLRRQSFTPGVLADGTPTTYGFGWYIAPFQNLRSLYHTGSTRGFRNAILRLPDAQLTVILLTNRNEGEPVEYARKIASLVLTSH